MYCCRGGTFRPPYRKIVISPRNSDSKEPKLSDLPHISMRNPPMPFWGLKMAKKGFYGIFVVGGTNFWIMKIDFLAFFEAKMTKIVILDQKLLDPNDYQQFWVHYDWF